MAFTRTDLRLTASDDNTGAWSYVTSDTLATVSAASYFNDVADQMRVGDVIHVVSGSTYGRFVVSANTGAAVTIVGWSASADQAVPTAAGSGATAGAFASADIRDEHVALLLEIRSCLVAHGLFKGAA